MQTSQLLPPFLSSAPLRPEPCGLPTAALSRMGALAGCGDRRYLELTSNYTPRVTTPVSPSTPVPARWRGEGSFWLERPTGLGLNLGSNLGINSKELPWFLHL